MVWKVWFSKHPGSTKQQKDDLIEKLEKTYNKTARFPPDFENVFPISLKISREIFQKANSNLKTPTKKINIMVDLLLKPVMRLIPNLIIDSNHLILLL